jgi:hypothetical protein
MSIYIQLDIQWEESLLQESKLGVKILICLELFELITVVVLDISDETLVEI